MRTVKIKVKIGNGAGAHSLDAVRYAAYSLSAAAYVLLEPAGKGAVQASFSERPGARLAGIEGRFKQALADEALREKNFDENRGLREFMILKALAAAEPAKPQQDTGLTPEQEKELDALIAQVESEIKDETVSGGSGDPLGIAKRWEDKNVATKNRKKK